MRNLRRHQIVSIILVCIAMGMFGSQFVQPLADTTASTAATLLNIIWLAGAVVIIPGIIPLFVVLFSIWMYFTTEAENQPLNNIPMMKTAKGWQAKFEPIPEQIEQLGLELFGAYTVNKRYFSSFNETVWVYCNAEQTLITGFVVYARGDFSVELKTYYSDGFMLGTLFNAPFLLDTQKFHIRSFESLNQAYDYHVYQMQLLAAEHGQPLRFTTLEAYLGSPETEISEKKAIALAGAAAHLSMAKYSILALVVLGITQLLTPLLGSVTTITSMVFLLLGIAFWFVDFITLPKQVLQTMEQRKKQKIEA